jgi:hypothetical protein
LTPGFSLTCAKVRRWLTCSGGDEPAHWPRKRQHVDGCDAHESRAHDDEQAFSEQRYGSDCGKELRHLRDLTIQAAAVQSRAIGGLGALVTSGRALVEAIAQSPATPSLCFLSRRIDNVCHVLA